MVTKSSFYRSFSNNIKAVMCGNISQSGAVSYLQVILQHDSDNEPPGGKKLSRT